MPARFSAVAHIPPRGRSQYHGAAYLKRRETLIASGIKLRTLADYKDTP